MYGEGSYAYSNTSVIVIGVLFTLFCLAILVAIGVLFGKLSSKEAAKQDRSTTLWFVLGFLFNFLPFIALKIANIAEKTGHNKNLWAVFGFIFGLWALVALESGINAENAGRDFDGWVILGFALGLGALLVSCFIKKHEVVVIEQSVSDAKEN